MAEIHAILYIEGDIRLLPIWLDYHKHIFDSGVVVCGDENILEIRHIVSRFFTDWTFQKTYPGSDEHRDCTVFLSNTEFLLNSNKHEIAEYCKCRTPIKVNASINEPFPNNVIDFVSNLSNIRQKELNSQILQDDLIEVRLLLTYLEEPHDISMLIYRRLQELENDRLQKLENYIYYLDAYVYSNYDWGEDRVILREDTNLLENTDFNKDGHHVFQMTSYTDLLKSMVETKIAKCVESKTRLETYHLNITDEEHARIINAMPWKKTESPEIQEFAEYMESRVSEIVGRRVKIFNNDIWVRICRPSSVTDYNPCHRDIYLDFYRNLVNIYLPIVGSNEKSSLAMQSGSHFWNENDLVVTKCGAYFKNSGKKYSVDAILRSKQPLDMIRPNPQNDEFILFSPYLIHGCSSNTNADTTRMSIEIRFIADDDNAKIQEDAFNLFLKERVWR